MFYPGKTNKTFLPHQDHNQTLRVHFIKFKLQNAIIYSYELYILFVKSCESLSISFLEIR